MKTDRIRVLEVFDSLEISGGVQRIVMNMVKNIDRDRLQIDFAVYDAPEENSYESEARSLGVNVFRIKNISEAGIFGFYKQLLAFFKQHPYDVVHAHNLLHNGIILSAAKKCNVKTRISHSHQSFDDRNNGFPRNIIAFFFKKLGLISATKLVACSDLAAEFLFGKNKDYVFLPNALDTAKYDIKKSDSEIRKNFGIGSETTHIIAHVGRFSYIKNQFFLLKIMDKLREEDCILAIAGEGELKEEFFERVKEYGLENKVKYLGLIENVPELLKISDCMLLPSLYEGLPVVGVEAQASGCFSLLSDTITKQADLGLGLVDYLSIDDAQIWADRVRAIMSNPPEKAPYDTIVEKMEQKGFENKSNLNIWLSLYGVS